MTRILVYILCCLWLPSLQLHGQPSESPDPAATKILKNLEEKINSFSDVKYTFTLNVDVPESEAVLRKGQFYMQGASQRLELGDFLLVSNGKSQWVVDKTAKEVQIHNYESSDQSNLADPKNLLAIYKNPDYEYQMSFEGMSGTKMVQTIEFKPLDRNSEYSKAKLTIDKKTGLIDLMEVFGKDGTRYTLVINDTKSNLDLSSSMFQIEEDDFKEFHFEDLRL